MRTRLRSLRARAADERGVALVTALLVTVVTAALGATAMQISLHNTDSSSRDRGRTQAIHAAEAGIDATLALIERTSSGLLPCTDTGQLNAKPKASWSVEITWYSSYPPNAEIPCNVQNVLGVNAPKPRGMRIVSTGSVPTGAGVVARKMELQARIGGIRGRFDKAIVSNKTPDIKNALTIRGNASNDGDVLSNENFVCPTAIRIQGSVYVAAGFAELSQSCTIAEDLWANRHVSMTNTSRVNGNVYSTLGPITMNLSSYVARDATSGAACDGCAGRVGGKITTAKKLPPPPEEGFPPMVWDAQAWQGEGWQVNFQTCAQALAWMTNTANAGTKAILRITSQCELLFAQQMNIPRTAPVAIFTDGSITVANKVTFYSGNTQWQDMMFIVAQDASCLNGNGNVTMGQNTTFEKIRFFMYSPCTTTFSNGDSNARGQLYGDKVVIVNNLSFTYHEMFVPGNGEIDGYGAEIAYVREIL